MRSLPRHPRRIVVFTSKYRSSDGGPWLLSALAEELASLGVEVDVFLIGDDAGSGAAERRTSPRVHHFSASLGSKLRLPRGVFRLIASVMPVPRLVLTVLRRGRYDLLLCISPCTACLGSVALARLLAKRQMLVYWDFFPLHNLQAGLELSPWKKSCAKWVEARLMRGFSRIGLVGQHAQQEFAREFGDSLSRRAEVFPMWGSASRRHGESPPKDLGVGGCQSIRFLFAGQLLPSRGLAQLLSCFTRLPESTPVRLEVAGSGPLADLVQTYARTHARRIGFHGQLARPALNQLVAECHVGVVSLGASGTSACWPSKSMDYMAAGLPLLALVPLESDLAQTVRAAMIGLAIDPDSVAQTEAAIERLALDPHLRKRMGQSARDLYWRVHSPRSAAEAVLCKIL